MTCGSTTEALFRAEQVAALYNHGSNVIAPPETEIGELWMACVTPFSGSAAGETACTDTITVMDETVPVFVRSVESRWIDDRVEIAWALRGSPVGLLFDVYRSDDATPSFIRLTGAEIIRRGEEYVFRRRVGGARDGRTLIACPFWKTARRSPRSRPRPPLPR